MLRNRRLLQLLFAALCLLLTGALILRRFLFGPAVLLYKDIGTDSITAFYPDFVHLSRYIRSYGFPSWSFFVGMGQDLACATGNLIWQPVSWLPVDWIASALATQHLAKVLIAGLLFFRFLQLHGLRFQAALLGSLLLSFSAYMSIGSCWYWFADDVVCFAAILLGVELALRGGRWLILALAVAVAGMITPFHLYLSALLLSSYLPIRLFNQNGWQPKIILTVSLKLAAVVMLGVGLGAIVTLPYLHAVLNSPRGFEATSIAPILRKAPLFSFESSSHYVTALLRPFSNDILGTGTDFRGWKNYLEAPLTYCGLVSLLLLPQALCGGTWRRRGIVILFLIAILIPAVFPWFRHLFWLFQGDYYRAYSLFWVLGAIILSMSVFSRYVSDRGLRLWLLLVTTTVLVGILYAPFASVQSIIKPSVRSVVTILLVFYGLLLIAGEALKRQTLVAWLLVGLSAIELVQFSRVTISKRPTFRRDEVRGRVGDKNDIVEALRDLRSNDSEKFYRIRKLDPSGSVLMFTVNDAMVFGYYGTSSYRSFNNVNYTNFLTGVGAIPPNSEVDTHWTTGLLNYPILSLFACEKYALVDDPVPLENAPQYELVKRYEKGSMFRNKLFLPFGLAFDRYVSEDDFLQLSVAERAEALLQAVILSNQTQPEQHNLAQIGLSDLKQGATTFSLENTVAARRETALTLGSFSQTSFEGKISVNERSILVLQTPFDSGWHALQDGQTVPVTKVDFGLLGLSLNPGEHTIALHYRNPTLAAASIVTLASFLILSLSVWRWPRIKSGDSNY